MITLPFDPLPNAFNVLAIFYRFTPSTPEFTAIANYFSTPTWQESWLDMNNSSIKQIEELNEGLSQLQQLKDSDWKSYFGLECILPAPPWGSVYLDPEQAVNTETTIAVEQFLLSNHIQLNTGINEPIDHIGLLFMIMAHLANETHDILVESFYRDHIYPWVYKYTENLKQQFKKGHYGNSTYPLAINSFILLTELTLHSIFHSKAIT